MHLEGKIAIVYGGGGVLGGAIARALARDGATVYLAGRTRAKLEAVARAIAAAGGTARLATVDALDEEATRRHADAAAAEAGGIDIAVNAVGIRHAQGTPLVDLSLEDYEHPLRGYARTLFVTAKAVARPMIARGSGVFLTLSTPAARLAFPGVLGFGAACAAIEAFSRHLAHELGPRGVRAVCLRPDATPETVSRGSHAREVFAPLAERAGTTIEAMLAGAAQATLLKRLPTVEQVAEAAAFAASDRAAAMTAAVMNLSCGSVVD